MKLSDFRQMYPEYDDIPDEELLPQIEDMVAGDNPEDDPAILLSLVNQLKQQIHDMNSKVDQVINGVERKEWKFIIKRNSDGLITEIIAK